METRKNGFLILIMLIFFHIWEFEFAITSFTFGAGLLNLNSLRDPAWLVQGLWSFCKVVHFIMLVYFLSQNCEINEPANEKPIVPIINDETLPKFLRAKRLQNAVGRNNPKLNPKLKLFSGTANPSLSQVNTSVCEDLGMPSYKYCHILTIILNATEVFPAIFHVPRAVIFVYHYPYSLVLNDSGILLCAPL